MANWKLHVFALGKDSIKTEIRKRSTMTDGKQWIKFLIRVGSAREIGHPLVREDLFYIYDFVFCGFVFSFRLRWYECLTYTRFNL